jgi:hypothetical protein
VIEFALFVAIASQQMCLESPHRRECVAAARQCLIEHADVDRDAAFETCVELLDPTFFERSF